MHWRAEVGILTFHVLAAVQIERVELVAEQLEKNVEVEVELLDPRVGRNESAVEGRAEGDGALRLGCSRIAFNHVAQNGCLLAGGQHSSHATSGARGTR